MPVYTITQLTLGALLCAKDAMIRLWVARLTTRRAEKFVTAQLVGGEQVSSQVESPLEQTALH